MYMNTYLNIYIYVYMYMYTYIYMYNSPAECFTHADSPRQKFSKSQLATKYIIYNDKKLIIAFFFTRSTASLE